MRRQTGAAHTDLADVLADQGRYAEAQAEYETALEIVKARRWKRVAVVSGQLGTLALRQGDLAEARRRYREALECFRAMGEEQTEAIVWHQLGRVAQGRGSGTRPSAATGRAWPSRSASATRRGGHDLQPTGHRGEGRRRPAQAERWYRRAIELDEEIGNASGLAIVTATSPTCC